MTSQVRKAELLLRGGVVTDDGGAEVTSRGIVWDEEANPTVDLPTITMDGTGTGEFSSEMTGLKSSTTYFYRAYAINSAGIAYGAEKEFVTGMDPTMQITAGSCTIDLILVEGGTFDMGATAEQAEFADKYSQHYEYPVHKVTLSDYYIAKFEVTQGLWIEIMGSNPSMIVNNNDCPVDNITWEQCNEFIEKLNEKTGLKGFALPTEAQWEYAARGGKKSLGYVYSGSDDATEVGWCMDNMVEFGQQPCGMKVPNELGIYDMTGNVNEYCSDYYDFYSEGLQTDPKGPETGDNIIVRGGSFLTEAEKYCRNSKRQYRYTNEMSYDLGMRLVFNVQ